MKKRQLTAKVSNLSSRKINNPKRFSFKQILKKKGIFAPIYKGQGPSVTTRLISLGTGLRTLFWIDSSEPDGVEIAEATVWDKDDEYFIEKDEVIQIIFGKE
jgi:hypothetical protein